VAALAWYLLAYLFMNLGAFTALAVLRDDRGTADLAALAGAWRRQPWIAAALTLALVSLAGIPPLSGFFAKWLLVRELVVVGLEPGQGWLLALALLLLLGAVIAAVAYLRIVRALFTGADAEPATHAAAHDTSPETVADTVATVSLATVAVLVVCSTANLLLGLTLPLFDRLRIWCG
jgi:NADH-quinone oxidoreductase subunit N